MSSQPKTRTRLRCSGRQLDPGAEAIVVAAELAADLLLVDEKRGRRIAIDRGLEVTGLLGVLAEAKARGLIPRCQPVLDDMIRVAGFWIGDDLRSRYLQGLNEIDQVSDSFPTALSLVTDCDRLAVAQSMQNSISTCGLRGPDLECGALLRA